MLNHPSGTFFHRNGNHLHTKVLFIISLRKVIAIINDTVSSKHIDLLSNRKVPRGIVFLFGKAHARIVSKDWLFGQFLFL